MQLMKALAAQPFNYMEYEEIRFAIDDWRQNNKWLPKKIHKYLAASSEVIGFITPTANYQINIVGNFNMRTSMGIKGAKGFIGFLKDVFTHNLIKSPCISRLTPIQKVHINLALKSLEKMYDVDPESNSEWKWRTVYNGIMGLDYLSYRWREDKLYGNPINSKLKNNIDYPFIRAHQEGDLPKEILYSFETACSYLAYVNPGRNNMLKLWKGSDKVGKVKALLQFAYFSVAGCMLGDKPKSMTPADGKKLLDVLLKYQREQLKVIGISEPYLEEIEKLKEELSNLNEMEIHRIKMADVIR